MSTAVATKWSILHVRPPWLQLGPPLFMHVLWLSILKNISRWYKCKDETVLILLGRRLKYSGRHRPLPIAADVMNYLHNERFGNTLHSVRQVLCVGHGLRPVLIDAPAVHQNPWVNRRAYQNPGFIAVPANGSIVYATCIVTGPTGYVWI